jgi:hypothetical protein
MRTSQPLELLPPGLTFEYLRKLAGVDPVWDIRVEWIELDLVLSMAVTWDLGTMSATIQVNPAYLFTARAMARGITHELLELQSIDTWIVVWESTRTLASGQRLDFEHKYRTARDRQISQRLGQMPFWSGADLPVHQSALGRC